MALNDFSYYFSIWKITSLTSSYKADSLPFRGLTLELGPEGFSNWKYLKCSCARVNYNNKIMLESNAWESIDRICCK